jgi:L-lactate dehydrogenase
VLLTSIESQCGSIIDPKARPKVLREMPGMALIDGEGVAGPVCVRLAGDLARGKAAQTGIAIVSVRNTSWIAALGAYLVPLAREGFFAQLMAQSCKCMDAVPPGGIDACFSTNPMALAFPTAADPVVADFSTATMAMGRVGVLAKSGKKAAFPVFLTKGGELTDDPNAVLQGGAMLPAGGDADGHKGYALALWIEALTAMAGGSCNNPDAEQRQSFTLTLMAPDALGTGDWYRSEMSRLSGRIRSGRRRPGVDAIRLPGERLQAEVERARKGGVEVSAALLASLTAAAQRHHLAPPAVMN